MNHEKKNIKKQQMLVESDVHIANYIGRFAYVNNIYDIELGHKLHDKCLIRNIKGPIEKYFLPIAVSHILKSNH